MKIADIMTKQVHTITPDKTLKECTQILKQRNVNGLVVLESEKVTGIITKTDLFKAILPSYADIIEDERNIASFEYIEERTHKLYDIKVRDFMSTPLITVDSNMPVIKAGSLMILKRVKQLPVVDNGALKGIVTLTDIMNAIADKLGKA
jgi:acetoin utilization protein AcuB